MAKKKNWSEADEISQNDLLFLRNTIVKTHMLDSNIFCKALRIWSNFAYFRLNKWKLKLQIQSSVENKILRKYMQNTVFIQINKYMRL